MNNRKIDGNETNQWGAWEGPTPTDSALHPSGHLRVWALVGLLHLGTLYGCGAQPASEDLSAERAKPLADRLALLDRDLGPSARGNDVLAVHDYLAQYGYLPNDELTKQFVGWSPVVASTPSDPMTFDDVTQEAVRALQKSLGLPVTGIVDRATRAMMTQPRCGVPEGLPHVDPAEKFSLHGDGHSRNFTWMFGSSPLPPNITYAQARTAFSAALWGWQTTTSITAQETIAADFNTLLGSFDNLPSGIFGSTAYPSNGNTTRYALGVTWSVADTTPPGALDLQTFMLHETGHALGLEHSSISIPEPSVMLPTIPSGPLGQIRFPTADDAVATSSIYDIWKTMPGAATDVGIAANGITWVIGNVDGSSEGPPVFGWDPSIANWVRTDGNAVRVSAGPDGTPWVVTRSGAIFRKRSPSRAATGWDRLPGCGTDIAVGADGSAWVIGCAAGIGSGNTIHKWNPSTGQWDQSNGAARRIAVGPDGIPWVVSTNQSIHRRSGASATSGSWTPMPGAANDITIDTDGHVWIISADTLAGSSIRLWNEQGLIGDGTDGPNSARPQAQWVYVHAGAVGTALAISAGNGGVWVVNNANTIFRQTI